MTAAQIVTVVEGPLSVDVPVVGVDGRTRYRRIITLALPLGGAVDGLALDPGAVQLDVAFSALDFDARAAATDSHGHTSAGAGGVVVRLDGRWAVHTVQVAAAVTGAIALHRLDGDTPSTEPTISRDLVDAVATFPQTGEAQFLDVRFVVRAPVTGITPGQLLRLGVRSYPTGARLGLAVPGDPDAAQVFWQAPGESREPVAAAVGPQLGEALARHVADRFAAPGGVPGDTLQVDLVVESDAPCVLDLGATPGSPPALALPFAPRVEGFADGPAKRVLRFSEAAGFSHELTVRVPGGVAVAAAELTVLPSFSDTVADAAVALDVNTPPTGDDGLFVDGSRWVGVHVVAPDATAIRGLAVPLAPLRAGTRMHAELHTDAGGQPSGEALRVADFPAPAAGTRAWAAWTFNRALPPPAAGFWLVMTAAEGATVWLAEPGTGQARVMHRAPKPGPFELQGIVDTHVPGFRLVGASTGTAGGAPAPFAVCVGETAVPVPPAAPAGAAAGRNAERLRCLDLGPAVSAWIATLAPPAPPGPVDIPVTFTSALPGILTVYPPRVELAP